MIYIGIDPDVEKSGVAVNFGLTKITYIYNHSYIDIFRHLGMIKGDNPDEEIKVVIEKGELNKAIFKASKPNSKVRNKLAHAAKIGSSVGRNFEATNIIEQFCIYLDLDYEFYIPNKTMPKLNNTFVQKQFKLDKKRTNEEQRDALRCIMKYVL